MLRATASSTITKFQIQKCTGEFFFEKLLRIRSNSGMVLEYNPGNLKHVRVHKKVILKIDIMQPGHRTYRDNKGNPSLSHEHANKEQLKK